MKIVLATGIYHPDIGGPATYVRELAKELTKRGMEIVVVTYGEPGTGDWGLGTGVVIVGRSGGPLIRWWRYERALRTHAADADVVIAFSLVSCGVPLWLARLGKPFDKAQGKPKKILRLGGDFLWERYTDWGGWLGLREWYASLFWRIVGSFFRWLVGLLLRTFDYAVFSTQLQERICVKHYPRLPPHSVIENALPAPTPDPSPAAAGEGRTRHRPFRLLYLGRLVAFKNLSALLRAMTELPGITLTLVGEGPLLHILEGNVQGFKIQDRVTFRSKSGPEERDEYFRSHDLLVIPSVTEISPNTALEARATGLPVLLTEETGLSERLCQGMVIRKLRTPEQIRDAIREVIANYERVAEEATRPVVQRWWGVVGEEYLRLFNRVFHLSLVAPHPNTSTSSVQAPLPRGEGNLL